ncbi:MAG: lipocalin-like domain-containing protein [Prevotella sp.]|jgi:hypothetical protein
MKRTLFSFIILVVIVGQVLQSCELETSPNGDLDGLWHLVQVDTLMEYDGVEHRLDLSNEHRYWAFQNDLMQTNNTDSAQFFIYRFAREGDSLIVSEPRVNDRDAGDTLVTDLSLLQPFGINAFRESFYVIKLSGSTMELQSQKLILNFKKF